MSGVHDRIVEDHLRCTDTTARRLIEILPDYGAMDLSEDPHEDCTVTVYYKARWGEIERINGIAEGIRRMLEDPRGRDHKKCLQEARRFSAGRNGG